MSKTIFIDLEFMELVHFRVRILVMYPVSFVNRKFLLAFIFYENTRSYENAQFLHFKCLYCFISLNRNMPVTPTDESMRQKRNLFPTITKRQVTLKLLNSNPSKNMICEESTLPTSPP